MNKAFKKYGKARYRRTALHRRLLINEIMLFIDTASDNPSSECNLSDPVIRAFASSLDASRKQAKALCSDIIEIIR